MQRHDTSMQSLQTRHKGKKAGIDGVKLQSKMQKSRKDLWEYYCRLLYCNPIQRLFYRPGHVRGPVNPLSSQYFLPFLLSQLVYVQPA